MTKIQRARVAPDNEELRRCLIEVSLRLAETEGEVARYHDQLAAQRPERADEYRRVADRARENEPLTRLVVPLPQGAIFLAVSGRCSEWSALRTTLRRKSYCVVTS